MWAILKVFTEFVTIFLLFYVLGFGPWVMWDPNSRPGDWTHTPCIGGWGLNHWTAREDPRKNFKEGLERQSWGHPA